MAKKSKYSKELDFLLLSILVIIILLLSISNLSSLSNKERVVSVLGTNTDYEFWVNFVQKHPDYIDGWLELNRLDKVAEIDPNYFK